MGETTTTTTTVKPTDATTTTEKPVDTTTTTQAPEPHTAPTGDEASVNHPGGEASPAAERQGEVAIDKDAETPVVGGVPSEQGAAQDDADVSAQNIEDAKADGLRNAAREKQTQPTETGQPERA